MTPEEDLSEEAAPHGPTHRGHWHARAGTKTRCAHVEVQMTAKGIYTVCPNAGHSQVAVRRNGNDIVCATCGSRLTPKRASRRQRYCGSRCREEARRKRNFAIWARVRCAPKQNRNQVKITQSNQWSAETIFGVEGPLEIVGHGHRWPRPPRPDARYIRNAIAAELGAYVLRRPPTDGGDR